MKKNTILILTFAIILGFAGRAVSAQFPIKIPKLPKTDKTKPEQPKTNDPSPSGQTNSNESNQTVIDRNENTVTKPIDLKPVATATSLFLKDTLEIKVKPEDKYWKFPNQRYYRSWVPQVSFEVFVIDTVNPGYTAEWFKPDGSVWYSEALETGGGNDSTRIIRSEYNYKLFDNTSTDQAGKFGLKITDSKTREVVFQGKFTVKKSPDTPGDPQMKNSFQFFVDNDWHLAVGYAGYHERYSLETRNGIRPTIYLWFKGLPQPEDMEARLFYNDRQITSTADGGRIYNKKIHGDGCARGQEVCRYGLYSILWHNFVIDKDTVSSYNYPNAFSSKDMPGEYTIKVFHKGVPVREAKFTIAPNGTVGKNGFSGNIYPTMTMIPVKVLDTTEKWNPNAWKTEMFYGNPVTGFSIQ